MDNNFIVSARKYRPMTFESVVGQSHITDTLKNAIARGQLAHAYLFCGPRGVGKTTCARIFAKTINCLNPTAEGDACGECESCRSFNEGRSFSIHELDAASNNSVENIRDLTDQVRVPPQVGQYSVYIIDEVHMLSQAAFNAFLKTLEEPPHHAIFILATTEKHKIIPTILSRCQIYDFNRIRIEDTVSYLKYIAGREGVQFDDESLHLIARKADGGMRDALSMFDKAVSFCGDNLAFKEVAATLNVLDYDTYFGITQHILAGDYKSALLLFDDVLKKGFSGQIFMSGLASHFRDLLMCKDPATLPLLETTGSVLERYKQQSAACDVASLFGAISLLGALDGGFRTATNQRLHVELGLMKLCGLEQKKNSDVGAPALPPLVKGAAAAPAAATPAPAPTVATTTASAPAAPTTTAPAPTVATPAQPAPQPTVVPQATIAPQVPQPNVVPQAQQPAPRPAVQPTTTTPRKSIFGGGSIAAIMNGMVEKADEEENTIVHYDPDTESKIAAHREEFISELAAEFPRLSYALKGMKVSGHTISAVVMTDLLREDILRHSPEITTILQRTCGVDGGIVIDIAVTKDKGVVLPVKSEDKVKFLTKENPELLNLIKELDLDIE
ncbi:MAG: DNA polymerase III subunit gamma/tau [Tidjanibacter sp.]|nr:DNA polymerase III subunit gamma/tau [Tidjanibacter sp.]